MGKVGSAEEGAADAGRAERHGTGDGAVGGARAEGGRRRPARSLSTRQALLVAALEVFTRRGYGGASIAEIVERSGASVGSLYHHFGGKAGIYLALWEEYEAEQERQASRAVAEASRRGVEDAMALFVAGTRGYLEGCWEQRQVARLFLENDGPSDFGLLRRTRGRGWVRRNTKLLRAGDGQVGGERAGRVLVLALTTVIGEAGREVATCDSAEEAREVIDEVCELITRLTRPRP